MSEPFLGEIRCFGFNFAPVGWATCDGQLMPISQNTALFSLLGTTYGGNGITTFGLPNLQGRVGVHADNISFVQGETGGEASHTLSVTEMPAHAHNIESGDGQTTDRPSAAVAAIGGVYAKSATGAMAPTAGAGGSQPHNNMQPYLVLNYCIALQGIFPPRS